MTTEQFRRLWTGQARRLLGALGIAVLSGTAAQADTFHTPPLKPGVPTSVQAYGQQNPACLEWTNGCVLCSMDQGHARCSTPGIACQPAGVTCKKLSR